MRHIVYSIVRPWGRWGVQLWHRVGAIEGENHLAYQGDERPARLLFSGHQNGLADPVLACVTLGPQLHFFTRADVFRKRAARWFLLRLNMMPIFRPIDKAEDMADRNRQTFAAAHARLEGGATCGIFPEAGHLDERRIRRFRHGSARFIAGALQRAPIRERGLEVLPLHLDFERYAGYRTVARVRIGPPISFDGIEGLEHDAGTARVELSDRMRHALVDCSVHLLDGLLYDPHLAVCRFLEGSSGSWPDEDRLARAAAAMQNDPERARADFEDALASGLGDPRTADDFAAAGRLCSGRSTHLALYLWRIPAWVIFMATTGWWPRLAFKAAERRVKQVAFRTTFSIPLTMVAVSLTWAVLSLGAGVATGKPLAVIAALLVLRGSQQWAMPLEDAIMDWRAERRVRRHMVHPFLTEWCGTPMPAGKKQSGPTRS